MKPAQPRDPVRWRDGDADTHAIEERAALLADAAAREVQPLTPSALSRIRSEIVAQRSPRRWFAGFSFRRLGVPGRLAFAIALVLMCVTTAGGARVLWRKYIAAPPAAVPSPAELVPPRTSRPAPPVRSRTAAVDTPPASVEEAPAQLPLMEAPRESPPPPPAREVNRPATARPSSASPADRVHPAPFEPAPTVSAPAARTPPAPPPPSAPSPAAAPPAAASEAALVAEALVQLRQRNDARAALAILDRHAREFPHGVLETEARRTRIEAVLQLGDTKTALALLDGKPSSSEALGADLTLTRAELRAAAGRFREALSDFDRVVDGTAGPLGAGGDERALYGRAVCLGWLGQDERARADLLAYQQRFPAGRFAREVKRLLAGKEAPAAP